MTTQPRDPMAKIVATNIRTFRQALGLSQLELSEILNVSIATVTNWEQALRRPQMLWELSQVLQRPMDDFYLENPPEREISPISVPAWTVKTIAKDVPPDMEQKVLNFISRMNEAYTQFKLAGGRRRSARRTFAEWQTTGKRPRAVSRASDPRTRAEDFFQLGRKKSEAEAPTEDQSSPQRRSPRHRKPRT